MARLDDMVRRIVGAQIEAGLVDQPPQPNSPIDFAAHADVAQAVAEHGIVLLKNTGILPLRKGIRRLLVIGAHADQGVLSGGGSSQVRPGWRHPVSWRAGRCVLRQTEALRPRLAARRAAKGTARHARHVHRGHGCRRSGRASAQDADTVIVFAEQWMKRIARCAEPVAAAWPGCADRCCRSRQR